MSATNAIGLAIVASSFLGCATFAVIYWKWFPWWTSSAGRNLFAFVTVDGLINLMFAVSILGRDGWQWLQWVLLGFYGLQPAVIWWRVVLIVRVHRQHSRRVSSSDRPGSRTGAHADE